MRTPLPSRRDMLRLASAGVLGGSLSGWLPAFAAEATQSSQRRRSCILLWMSGGPSTIDMFDMKPGHENGGPFKEIGTSAPGIKICEHLPLLARQMKNLSILRGMSTKEGDHTRGTYVMRTGNTPSGAIQYPTIGSLVAKEIGDPTSEMPSFVSVAPFRQFSPGAFGSGFLGPQYDPLIVAENNFSGNAQTPDQVLKVQDIARPADVSAKQASARVGMLKDLEDSFMLDRPAATLASHQSAYDRAIRLMESVGSRAFDLKEEPDRLRDSYGRNLFGQGCMLARRLVERGVPFIEVSMGGVNGQPFGWDTHQNNFESLKPMLSTLDKGWGTLMADLEARGLLETTTILWMGEFGRTPRINGVTGRDHFPNAWASVIGGGGIKGGQVVGRTSEDGTRVEDRVTTNQDLLATLCTALGIDYSKNNNSNVGRPIRIVDKAARVVTEIV